ncbi:HNH endonuclease [Roseimaritima multifibrata]|uniref:HNH endonuclease n=1 Tax=Roseimaritima multifibrata TaxID=1930274 RepID=A0A517MG68_9BACT|nr:HNH endonuclease signature motif containing protein [Roseimaritima multifibrata]QDS93866.1 HNH endonuclease [Roseimaritima multifibrata]
MSEYVPAPLRRAIRQRANQHCEYCLIHEDDVLLSHEPDHIIATKHGGKTSEANLAWTCFLCNRAKGSDIASIDPETNEIVRLFSPRSEAWETHFDLQSNANVLGKTPIGRATVALLKLNRVPQVEIRRTLMDAGLYPPLDDSSMSDESL